jgi:hypothetical protein
MEYQVRYRTMRDDKILCEVVGLDDQRRPTGPIVARGTGGSKNEARSAALGAATDPAVKALLTEAGQ